MSETFKRQKNISLITLQGLRDFVKSKIPFEYEFVLVGFTARGIPRYQAFVCAKDEKYILVVSRVDVFGAKIKLLNLDTGAVKFNQEFGSSKLLQVQVDKKHVQKPHVL